MARPPVGRPGGADGSDSDEDLDERFEKRVLKPLPVSGGVSRDVPSPRWCQPCSPPPSLGTLPCGFTSSMQASLPCTLVLPPSPHVQASLQGDLRELGQAITRDIFTDNPNVRWEDISGLDQVWRSMKKQFTNLVLIHT